MLNDFKAEQIAVAVPGDVIAKRVMSRIGGEWIHDRVTFKKMSNGTEGQYDLHFNYSLGIEYEVLVPRWGPFWLSHVLFPIGGRPNSHEPIPSHIGTHVPNAVKSSVEWANYLGVSVAQSVETIEHTNEYLRERNRTFRYVVLDTRELLGHDLKFIERVER